MEDAFAVAEEHRSVIVDVGHVEEERRLIPFIGPRTQPAARLRHLASRFADAGVPAREHVSVGTDADRGEMIVLAEDRPPRVRRDRGVLLARGVTDKERLLRKPRDGGPWALLHV